jgi:hypothetical protein
MALGGTSDTIGLVSIIGWNAGKTVWIHDTARRHRNALARVLIVDFEGLTNGPRPAPGRLKLAPSPDSRLDLFQGVGQPCPGLP